MAAPTRAFPERKVTVAVRRPEKHIDDARLDLVALAAAAAFQNIGSFVFGDHALDLQQQLVFGILADGMVEEDHVHASALKLIDQQDLVRIFTGEAIRGVHVQTFDAPDGHRIAQSLQRGPHQGYPAIPLIDEAPFR